MRCERQEDNREREKRTVEDEDDVFSHSQLYQQQVFEYACESGMCALERATVTSLEVRMQEVIELPSERRLEFIT